MRYLLFSLIFASFAAPLRAEIVLEPIEYTHGETTLQGWFAHDPAVTEKRPGILVVHQWTGVTDYEKRRAEMLAEMGYVAFVADIYGKGVNPSPGQESGQWSGKFKGDRDLYRARLNKALEVFTSQPGVDAGRIGAIGYCFGGTGVLELARSGANVKGVVSFHGGLGTPSPGDANNIKGSVLVLHGAVDPHSPLSEVQGLIDEMEAADVDYHVVLYGQAVHSFTEKEAGNDPSRGAAYNKEADERSWEHMQRFFEEVLR